MIRVPRLAFALTLVALAGSACSQASSASAPVSSLRLGYFPNITHATAVAGVARGIFQRELGSVKLEPRIFNAGPVAVEAIYSGALDATYVGPSPAINAFTRSKGQAVRIIAGATAGGAALVVAPSIANVSDLKGKTLATPQRGNTQDIALRSWLSSQGFKTTTAGGGDVSIVSQENAQTLDLFKSRKIDGAWVPEPWASRLVLEGGGHVLVDEATLWPEGKYVTTVLLVRAQFLRNHPDVVRKLLLGHIATTAYLNDHPSEAKTTVGNAIRELTGKTLKPKVIDRAWANLAFTADPFVATLKESAERAVSLRFLPRFSLDGIADLSILNALLQSAGKPVITS